MAPTTHCRRRPLPPAVRHYLEMVLAMGLGMVVLGAVAVAASVALGSPPSAGAEGDALLMLAAMTVPMAWWMRRRGHGWVLVAEMAGAMAVPFVALFVPLWTATITPGELMVAGHVLMLVTMAAVTGLRRREYARPHGRRRPA